MRRKKGFGNRGFCPNCGIKHAEENTCKSGRKDGYGICRECTKEKSQMYRVSKKDYISDFVRKRRKKFKKEGVCWRHTQENLPCKICPKVYSKHREECIQKGICPHHKHGVLEYGKTLCTTCLLNSRLAKLPRWSRNAAKEALNSFKGHCECCGGNSARPNKNSWCLDHDHTSGKFRGILCHDCNTALGYVKDSIVHLNLLSRYLRRIL